MLLITSCTTRPRMENVSPSLSFSLMAACMCACMCAYVHVWLHICVLCCLCGLSQNIEFRGLAIPGAVGVACGAILDGNADGNRCYF